MYLHGINLYRHRRQSSGPSSEPGPSFGTWQSLTETPVSPVPAVPWLKQRGPGPPACPGWAPHSSTRRV
ncbi:hypothetical protein Nmel_013312, partial [Mimus melanotis]